MNENKKLNIKSNLLRKQACLPDRRGFSLVEVIVTLLVLSIGIVAVSILMTNNIKNSESAKNQIIASQLAQEGVELVRNLKDNKNVNLNAPPYDRCVLVAGVCETYTDYRIDETMTDLDTITTDSKQLYLNNNFYTHNNVGGTATKFFRSISLLITGDSAQLPSSTRVVTIASYVSWNGNGIPATCNIASKCVSVVSVLPDLN